MTDNEICRSNSWSSLEETGKLLERKSKVFLTKTMMTIQDRTKIEALGVSIKSCIPFVRTIN